MPDDRAAANPIGVRRPARPGHDRARRQTVDAPSMAMVDALDEAYGVADAEHRPEGLGPVPPFWRARQRFAGTYDDAWLSARHPQLPADFDYRFYQCAPPPLALPHHLRGDETIELVHLLPGRDRFRFELPGTQPVARYEWLDGREVALRCNLDGAHLDLREPPVRVDLTWRAWLPVCPSFFKIDLTAASIDETATIPRSGLHGMADEDRMEPA